MTAATGLPDPVLLSAATAVVRTFTGRGTRLGKPRFVADGVVSVAVPSMGGTNCLVTADGRFAVYVLPSSTRKDGLALIDGSGSRLDGRHRVAFDKAVVKATRKATRKARR